MPVYLSVIIPAFNEEQRILETLQRVSDYLKDWQWRTGKSFEIVVVDDGSTDSTKEQLRRCAIDLTLIAHQINRGKGFAVRAGMLKAGGQYRIFTDADNSTPIHELNKLLTAGEKGAPVVIGSRNLKDSRVVIRQPLARRWLGRLANWAIQVLALWGIKDTQCGFKCFQDKAAEDLFSSQTIDGWGFDFEILAIARRRSYQIVEVPVSWYNSKQSRVRPIRGALRTLAELLTIRWNLWRGKYDRKQG